MRYKTQWLGEAILQVNVLKSILCVEYGRVPMHVFFKNIISDVCSSSYGVKIILFAFWITPALALNNYIFENRIYLCCMCKKQMCWWSISSNTWKKFNTNTTLCGGSLGSRVDEERSKLRELMWFAGHIDHRYLERILRLGIISLTTPVWGSVLICKKVKLFLKACSVVK